MSRLIFMGTADLAAASLNALLALPGWEIVAVVAQPDRPKGRDLKLIPPPVKVAALAAGLPVWQPEKARQPEFVAQLQAAAPDLIVVAAYGQILPASILTIPRLGCLNVHASLLPKFRGASPIQASLLADEPETGVTIMQMDVGLDTGAMLTTVRTPILPEDNAQTLHDRLARLGAELIVRTIPEYAAGKITPQPQPAEGVSYAGKIRKEDGLLDWSLPARTLWNRVRAFTPWPGAFTYFTGREGRKLLKVGAVEIHAATGNPGEILKAEKGEIIVGCGQQSLRLLTLQKEGGRRLGAQEFLTGHPLEVGSRLG